LLLQQAAEEAGASGLGFGGPAAIAFEEFVQAGRHDAAARQF
jgi:hypothetical protein